jgi:predicted DNA-binding transcriptional regulator AlpA
MNEIIKIKDVYLTVSDYATFANVTEKTIYNWIDSGKIPKDKIKTVLNITLIKKELYS